MKNKIIVALFALGMLAIGSKVMAESSVFDGWTMKVSTGTSVNLIPARDGSSGVRVRRIYASSDTASVPTNWFQLFDTGVSSAVSYAFLDQSKAKTPPIYFPIPSTVTLGGFQAYSPVFESGDEGIRFSSACYVYKSANGSGAALQVGVELR